VKSWWVSVLWVSAWTVKFCATCVLGIDVGECCGCGVGIVGAVIC